MKQFLSTVISNRQIAADYYEMELSWDERAGIPQPGQFLTIRVSSQTQPLLRRPFAFSGFKKHRGSVALIYQKRGSATEILSGKTPDDKIDCIGPLGKGFKQKEQSKTHLCMAGGIGIGPIVFWAQTLLQQQASVTFILGAKEKTRIPRFAQWNELKPIVCTDDNSEGFKGTVVDYLKNMPQTQIAESALYCCGPNPMLKACHDFSQQHNLDCAVSMEQVMACGVGACMGCVIEIVGEKKYARVCTEGPVFNSKDIKWK